VTPADLAAIASGSLVGMILALIGGGGSILATPLLLYGVGVASPHVAIGTSALAVAVSAFANLIQHARVGTVKWPCALVFAAAGIAGATLGAQLGKATDPKVLMPLFALAMVGVGVNLLIAKPATTDVVVQLSPANAPRLVAAGAFVGLASGFFGIGGGFLIVPGLMAATGMAIVNAVSSSLVSVGAFGVTAATSYGIAGLIDWRVAAFFIAGGIAGGLAGMALGKRIAKRRGLLQRLFAALVFAVAGYVVWRSV
jgi:uncharacterized protein